MHGESRGTARNSSASSAADRESKPQQTPGNSAEDAPPEDDSVWLELQLNKYKLDSQPLLPGCECPTCKNHTRCVRNNVARQLKTVLGQILLQILLQTRESEQCRGTATRAFRCHAKRDPWLDAAGHICIIYWMQKNYWDGCCLKCTMFTRCSDSWGLCEQRLAVVHWEHWKLPYRREMHSPLP